MLKNDFKGLEKFWKSIKTAQKTIIFFLKYQELTFFNFFSTNFLKNLTIFLTFSWYFITLVKLCTFLMKIHQLYDIFTQFNWNSTISLAFWEIFISISRTFEIFEATFGDCCFIYVFSSFFKTTFEGFSTFFSQYEEFLRLGI